MKVSMVVESRRAMLGAALLSLPSLPLRPACAVLVGADDDQLARAYASGARASGGRGANTMIKERATTGVQRLGLRSSAARPTTTTST